VYSGLGDCRLSYISSQAISGICCSAVLGLLRVEAAGVMLGGRRKSPLAIGGRIGDEGEQAFQETGTPERPLTLSRA